MNFTIREATLTDKESIVELALGLTKYNCSHRTSRIGLEKRLEKRRNNVSGQFEETINDQNKLVLIAFADEEPIGYALAYIYEGYEGDYGYLDELFLRENVRGYGVGKQLLSKVSDWVKLKQGTRLVLNVYTWNKDAIGFYEGSGYTPYYIQYEKQL